MGKPSSALVVIAATFLTFGTGCTNRTPPPPPPRKPMPPISIFMTNTTTCDVSAPKANVYQHFNHLVTWQSEDGESYTVVFKPKDPTQPGTGSPFKKGTAYQYTIPADGSPNVTNPGDYGYFEYTIDHVVNNVGTKCKDTDPGLIVKG